MSPLRKKMQDAMVLRGLAARTQESYIAAVAGIAKHYRRSPDMLSSDEVERNLLHLIEERKLSWSTTNQAASALMFLYGPTLKRKEDRIVIPRRKVPAKQPEILSREEVARILEACSTVRQHTLLMTTYAAALPLWADICPSVTPAVPCATSITRAATASARSARRGPKRSGSRGRELLPVPYFHLVFTLPHALNGIAARHPRLLYELLFGAVSQTLIEFSADPRHLGGTPAFTLVLHTWTQELARHPHLPALMAGGALTDKGAWALPMARWRSACVTPVQKTVAVPSRCRPLSSSTAFCLMCCRRGLSGFAITGFWRAVIRRRNWRPAGRCLICRRLTLW